MKKTLSIILSLIMLLSALSAAGVTAFADESDFPESGECGTNASYTFDSKTGIITIKPEVDGEYSSIEGSFSRISEIKKVIIEEGVQAVCGFAFFWCNKIESVEFPSSMETLENGAFFCCEKLRDVYIPENLTDIEGGAFSGCVGIRHMVVDENNPVYDSRDDCNAIIETETDTLISGSSVTVIPDSVVAIGEFAYNQSYNMPVLIIPDNIKYIGDRAFVINHHIVRIYLPRYLETIGDAAFTGMSSLEDIYYDGPKSRFEKIEIGEYNDAFNTVKFHFNENAVFDDEETEDENEDGNVPSPVIEDISARPSAPKIASKKKNKVKIKLGKLKVKRSAKKLVVKAKVTLNGKAVKGKRVTVRFNGKKYKVKTNKKGIAKLVIKKKAIKKLKKGKKITYSVTYKKVTVKRKAKVKA